MPVRSQATELTERRHPAYEVAVIAQVLDALAARPAAGGEEEDEPIAPSPELENMIARAVSELGQRPAAARSWQGAGAAPVLGSGVLQGLIAARRRVARGLPSGQPPAHVDERL
jgi:hypothetical protein